MMVVVAARVYGDDEPVIRGILNVLCHIGEGINFLFWVHYAILGHSSYAAKPFCFWLIHCYA